MATVAASQTATDTDIDAILGQYLVGFGRGVDGLHVHRAAVTAVQTRCRKWIKQYVNETDDWNGRWKADAATVIGFMEAVGRLSAHFAMQESRTSVSEADVRRAIDVVVHEHPLKGVRPLGHWCGQ